MSKVRVAVRVRPFNRREVEKGLQVRARARGKKKGVYHPDTDRQKSPGAPHFAFVFNVRSFGSQIVGSRSRCTAVEGQSLVMSKLATYFGSGMIPSPVHEGGDPVPLNRDFSLQHGIFWPDTPSHLSQLMSHPLLNLVRQSPYRN